MGKRYDILLYPIEDMFSVIFSTKVNSAFQFSSSLIFSFAKGVLTWYRFLTNLKTFKQNILANLKMFLLFHYSSHLPLVLLVFLRNLESIPWLWHYQLNWLSRTDFFEEENHFTCLLHKPLHSGSWPFVLKFGCAWKHLVIF